MATSTILKPLDETEYCINDKLQQRQNRYLYLPIASATLTNDVRHCRLTVLPARRFCYTQLGEAAGGDCKKDNYEAH